VLSADGVQRVMGIYGGRAAGLAKLCANNRVLAQTLDDQGRILAAEIVFALREEFAKTLEDIVFRRMMIGFDPDQGRGLYEKIAALAATEAGWSEEQKMRQIEQLTEYAESLRVG
jgi:glycerol-3-phosphate dehydrogenase